MIYSIALNGICIYGDRPRLQVPPSYRGGDAAYPEYVGRLNRPLPGLTLISPSLNMAVNEAGSLDFTMPPDHVHYRGVRPLQDIVTVYEEDRVIWMGRVAEISLDMQKRKAIHCEGALAFLRDTVARPRAEGNYDAATLLGAMITEHNGQVDKPRRFTFSASSSTVSKSIVWHNEYQSTFDAVASLLKHAGGFLVLSGFPDITGDHTVEEAFDWSSIQPVTISYIAELPEDDGQTVSFGLNLVDFSQSLVYGELCTGILPTGPKNEETGTYMTIASVNDGSDILLTNAALTYGNFIKQMSFDSAESPSQLKSLAQAYLSAYQFDPLTIEVDAADLHFVRPPVQVYTEKPAASPLQIGTRVHVISEPHFLDSTLPITRMNIALDSAIKRFTFGTYTTETITEQLTKVNENVDVSEQVSEQISEAMAHVDETVSDIDERVEELESYFDSGESGHFAHWVGTLQEYQALSSTSEKMIYFIVPEATSGEAWDDD